MKERLYVEKSIVVAGACLPRLDVSLLAIAAVLSRNAMSRLMPLAASDR